MFFEYGSVSMYQQLIVLLEVFDYDSKEYAIQNQGYNNNNNNYNNNVRGTITIKKNYNDNIRGATSIKTTAISAITTTMEEVKKRIGIYKDVTFWRFQLINLTEILIYVSGIFRIISGTLTDTGGTPIQSLSMPLRLWRNRYILGVPCSSPI